MFVADILDISINLLFAVQIIVCIFLLGIILMQRPKQEGLGAAFGSALTDQAFGARTTDVLQKGTVYLGTMFMVFSFVLSLLVVHRNDVRKSTLGTLPAVATEVIKDIKPEDASKVDTKALEDLQKKLKEENKDAKPEQDPAAKKDAETVPAGPPPVPEPILN